MRFNGHGIRLYGDGMISVGEDSYIGRDSQIQAARNCSVTVGRYCAISHNVALYTKTWISEQVFDIETPRVWQIQDVKIGDYAWVGYGVFICPGVTIGNNVIVGANSVVIKDIPSFAITAGVPAKVIKWKQGCSRPPLDPIPAENRKGGQLVNKSC